jgi:hypothetical protein
VVASGCSLGGHRGHVYVDAFGASLPGGTVVATAPATVNAGAQLTYDLHAHNGGSGTLQSSVVSITLPPQTTFSSVSDPVNCSHSSGVVTCNFGDLATGEDRDFTLTVNTSPTASGTITLGTYSIAGTSYPALLGPTRSTTVVNTTPAAVADSHSVNEDTTLSVNAASGVPVTVIDTVAVPLWLTPSLAR